MGYYDNPPYYISAYALACKRGFEGTLDEWLASLKGDKGDKMTVADLTDAERALLIADAVTAARDEAESTAAEKAAEVAEETALSAVETTAARAAQTTAAAIAQQYASQATAAAQSAALALASQLKGAPNVAHTAAEMTDQNKIYVYTGSETGMTANKWYYHNGTAWTVGGDYQAAAVSTDNTLTVPGSAADAATAGGRIDAEQYARKTLSPALTHYDTERRSPNMADPGELIYGEVIKTSNGTVLRAGDAGWNVTEQGGFDCHLRQRVALTENATYYRSLYNTEIVLYKEDGTYLTGIDTSRDSGNNPPSSFTVAGSTYGLARYADVNVKSTALEQGVAYFSTIPMAGTAYYIADKLVNINALHRLGIPGKLLPDMFITQHPTSGYPYNGNNDTPNAVATEGFIYMPAGMGIKQTDIWGKYTNYVLVYDINTFRYTEIITATGFGRGRLWVADSDCWIRVCLRYSDGSTAAGETLARLCGSMEFFNTRLSPFYGKKISILGDSISTFVKGEERYGMPDGNRTMYTGSNLGVTDVGETYWKQTIDYLGMELLVNNSFSGRAVTTCRDNDTPSGSGEKVWAGTAGYLQAQADGLEITAEGQTTVPDVIIVRLGANDFNHEAPVGAYDGQDDGNMGKFREAFAVMMKNIMTTYPLADVYVCTMVIGENNPPYNAHPEKNGNGVRMNDYNAVIREMADLYNAKLIDQWCCGITYFNRDTYFGDYDSSGSTAGKAVHPNYKGHRLMAEKTIRDMLANPCR